MEKEHLRVILLDIRNHVFAIESVVHGSVNTAQINVGEISQAAIRQNALRLIVVHRHPGSDPTPRRM